MYGIVYTVTNKLNGKQYVGQTTQPIEKRWASHVSAAARNVSAGCRALYSAIRKYGPDALRVEAVIACDDQEELDRFEVMAIEAGGTLAPGGYNLRTGGNGGGRLTAETRVRLSEAARRKFSNPEARAKLSEANKGKTLSPEHRAKLSEAKKGQKRGPLSPEHRAKISAVKKGKPKSPEHRAKIGAANKRRAMLRREY